jgi:hypothetical protein
VALGASEAEEVRIVLKSHDGTAVELYLTDLDSKGPVRYIKTGGNRMVVSKPLPFRPSGGK